MAKGIVYTLAAFISGILILTFAIIIFKEAQNTEIRATETNLLNGINDLKTSISNSIKTLFENNAGITITIKDKTVTFTEEIPNNKTQNYKTNLTELKNFIEQDNRLVKIDTPNIDKLPLKIKPYDISYTRENLNSSKIELISPSVNNYYTNISISLTLTGKLGTIDMNNVKIGTTPVYITIKNSSTSITQTKNLDLNQNSEVEIEKNGIEDAEIELHKNLIIIENKANTPIKIESTLTLQDISTIKIVQPSIIKISFPEFETYITEDARIV